MALEEISISTRIFNFFKKQCILSFISILILFFGSIIWFDSRINPVIIELHDAPELLGPLEVNHKLRTAEFLHYRLIKGCESLVYINNYIYGSCLNGYIIRFNDTFIEIYARLGKVDCKKLKDCGRALGLRYDAKHNRILFVEAHKGLFSIELNDNRTITKLFPKNNLTFPVVFFNDLDILENGNVVITQSSFKFQLYDLIGAIFEGRPNGRLLEVNPQTGSWKILADNLYFPNGVSVHRKKQNLVLVTETVKYRIIAVDISDNATNKIGVFTDNLPGMPDNIRYSESQGGYWVNLATVRHKENSFLIDLMARYPIVRTVLKKIFMDGIIHTILNSGHSLIIRTDESGHIVESLHEPSSSNCTSSETVEVGQDLYLGTYYLPYIIKVPKWREK